MISGVFSILRISEEDRRDYEDFVGIVRHDTRQRFLGTLAIAITMSWITDIVFAAIWVGMVVMNEFVVFILHQRFYAKGTATDRQILIGRFNTLYGAIAWSTSIYYLWLYGETPGMVVGSVVATGVLIHATFIKATSSKILWANIVPIAGVLAIIPAAMHLNARFDLETMMIIYAAFAAKIGYFATAAMHNYNMHDKLKHSLDNLSASNAKLEMHQQHLEDLVAERTRELTEEQIKLMQSLAHERHLNEMQTQFVSVASHEFRTPLAIIDGNARRMGKKADLQGDEDQSNRAHTIRSAVERMTFLVERTLDSSKLASGQLELKKTEFDVRSMITEMLERYREVYPDHQVETDICDCPVKVFADAKLIDTALSNVISNAMKYSSTNPKVNVCMDCEDDALVIRVKDFGVGIPKADLANITTRFFRASNTDGIQGTGIGLNLVRTLIEMHDGSFHIDSEEGEWTETTIRLPVKDAIASDFAKAC